MAASATAATWASHESSPVQRRRRDRQRENNYGVPWRAGRSGMPDAAAKSKLPHSHSGY